MGLVKITINNREIEAEEGTNLLDVALKNDIDIPYFCYHPALKVSGNCRLCLVEVEGIPKLQPSCNTPVKQGMRVLTETPRIYNTRALMLELLTKNHPLDCPICDKSGECSLQDAVFKYGEKRDRYKEKKRTYGYRNIGDRIERNMDRCIMCTRCVRFVRDVIGSEQYGAFERGAKTDFSTFVSGKLTGNHQGNLHDICPVGALTIKDFRFKKRVWYLQKTPSICPFCATGCNIEIHHHQNQVYRLTPRENREVNGFFMCDSGREGYHRFEASGRLTAPLLRGAQIDWEQALERFTDLLRSARSYAVVGGANLANEDLYIISKFLEDVKKTELVDYRWTAEQQAGDTSREDFLLNRDRRPNSAGARKFGLLRDGVRMPEILDRVRQGKVDTLLVLEEELADVQIDPATLNECQVILLTSFKTETAKKVTLALPITGFAEAGGGFSNFEGRVQNKAPALRTMGEMRHPHWIFVQAASKIGPGIGSLDGYEAITRAMALPERID